MPCELRLTIIFAVAAVLVEFSDYVITGQSAKVSQCRSSGEDDLFKWVFWDTLTSSATTLNITGKSQNMVLTGSSGNGRWLDDKCWKESTPYTWFFDGITEVESNVFGYDDVPAETYFSKDLKVVHDSAFEASQVLVVNLSASPSLSFGKRVFKDSPVVRFVSQAGLETVPESMFDGCGLLWSLKVKPASVKVVEPRAFCGCRGLNEIDFIASVTSIGESAFMGAGVTEIRLDESHPIEKLGTSAFKGCLFLRRCQIPTQLSSLPDSVFEGCYLLSQVTYGDNWRASI